MKKNFAGLKKVSVFLAVVVSLLLISPLIGSLSVDASNVKTSGSITREDISYAVEELYPSLLKSILSEPSAFSMTDDELKGLKLCKPVRFVTPESDPDELMNNKNFHVAHLPVINENGRYILIFTVIKDGNNISATLGEDFSEKLNMAVRSGLRSVAFIQNSDGIKVLSTSSPEMTQILGISISDAVKASVGSLNSGLKIPYDLIFDLSDPLSTSNGISE